MKHTKGLIASIAVVCIIAVSIATVVHARGDAPKPSPVIYVTSQDLYYDSIVGPELPAKGPFQELEMEGLTGFQTEFGPGDVGYVGGRWWVDVNGNDEMDEEDDYFSCPLLGPGREAP